MREGATSSPDDSEAESQSSGNELVPATAYVPRSQYDKWTNEAEKRNQSISKLIASMVETGLNDIQLEKDSPSEMRNLRERLREIQRERDELREKLKSVEKKEYQFGLGKIKEIIIQNPGIDRREIVNFVSENTVTFAERYLDQLETSEFKNQEGKWYPPEDVGGDRK